MPVETDRVAYASLQLFLFFTHSPHAARAKLQKSRGTCLDRNDTEALRAPVILARNDVNEGENDKHKQSRRRISGQPTEKVHKHIPKDVKEVPQTS